MGELFDFDVCGSVGCWCCVDVVVRWIVVGCGWIGIGVGVGGGCECVVWCYWCMVLCFVVYVGNGVGCVVWSGLVDECGGGLCIGYCGCDVGWFVLCVICYVLLFFFIILCSRNCSVICLLGLSVLYVCFVICCVNGIVWLISVRLVVVVCMISLWLLFGLGNILISVCVLSCLMMLWIVVWLIVVVLMMLFSEYVCCFLIVYSVMNCVVVRFELGIVFWKIEMCCWYVWCSRCLIWLWKLYEFLEDVMRVLVYVCM